MPSYKDALTDAPGGKDRAVHTSATARVPGQPFLGTGEASQGPTAAALANAVHTATGLRFRDMPISPEAIGAALALADRCPSSR